MRKLLILMMLVGTAVVCADDYIDDIYYTPSLESKKVSEPKPKVKNGAREIVFIDDDIQQSADSVSRSQSDTITSKPTTVKAVVR